MLCEQLVTFIGVQAALATLQRVARYCGYDGVSALIVGNMDYLVDAVCGRLKFLDDRADVVTTAAVVECIAGHAYDASVPLIKVGVPCTAATTWVLIGFV